jgi:hypothetical protein
MILVIMSTLLPAAERGCRRHELASWAHNAQEWADYYAEQERRETNSSIRPHDGVVIAWLPNLRELRLILKR